MDAKSGRSFLVNGMSSGIDRQVEVESSGDLGQKKSHAYSNYSRLVMSTCAHIAQIPESCALMDAKPGKSFFVTGMSSGIDWQVEVESSGDLGQKKVTRL